MEDRRRERRRRGRAYARDRAASSTSRGARAAPGRHERSGGTPDANAVVALDGQRSRRRTGSPRRGRLQHHADGLPAQGQGLIAAAGNDGRLYLLDGVARRQRSQDAAVRHRSSPPPAPAARSRPGKPRARAGCWRRAGPRAARRRARRAPGAHRRVQGDREGRQAGARARLAVARSRVAAGADRRQRDRVRGLERRVSRDRRPTDRGRARATIEAGRALRARRATGKELWTSGKTITSFARAGLSAGGGQVYLVTYDNTLYAFGIPLEH